MIREKNISRLMIVYKDLNGFFFFVKYVLAFISEISAKMPFTLLAWLKNIKL